MRSEKQDEEGLDLENNEINELARIGKTWMSGRDLWEVGKCVEYIQHAKVNGLRAANKKFICEDNGANADDEVTAGEVHQIEGGNVSKQHICCSFTKRVRECKTKGQMVWLEKVLSYLIVFYNLFDEVSPPPELVGACKKNYPIVTIGPGGCGKSWLVGQVKEFLRDVMIGSPCQVWLENARAEDSCNIGPESSLDTENFGRFGRVVVFAAAGVAAGNAGGLTFHNGLRARTISVKTLQEEPRETTMIRLQNDFANAALIVVDEVFSAPLVSLSYLDKILLRIRPCLAHIPFGGFPVVAAGDPFQLPPAQGYSIITNEEKVLSVLRDSFHFFTNGSC